MENQMANTFFGFNTTLNDHADRLGSSPEDIEGLEAEEEYDALNDETFGALENEGEIEDWETQHEQLAEIDEKSRFFDELNEYIFSDQFAKDTARAAELFKYVKPKNNIWAAKNGEKPKSSKNSSSEALSTPPHNDGKGAPGLQGAMPPIQGPPLSKLRTVQELERSLLPRFKQQAYPPGFQTMFLPPAPARAPPGPWPVPPGLVRVLGPHGGRMPPTPPPGFPIYPHLNQPHHPQGFPVPGNYPLPARLPMPRPPAPKHHYNSHNNGLAGHSLRYQQERDEYAGLMNNREKQWLLNIQLLQVNTGTPYFDDYYYTVFKERQSRNRDLVHVEQRSNQRFQRSASRGGPGSSPGGEQPPTLTKKIYTPLQFENSLGKLQFGSVTAPRKIIDMDVISMDKDSESAGSARDSRKTKQLLLELEVLYSLLLKAEDLQNPVAVSNQQKLSELKQKQRLREIDLAPTPEQKQEILKLLQAESCAPVETFSELLHRLLVSLLQDDKLSSFVNIRKGKMFLLRLLPHLAADIFAKELQELWMKLLLSIPSVGRRDSIGDNILPKFYPLFKKYINVLDFDQILDLISGLVDKKLENHRSTPSNLHNKPALHFILLNKLGVSVLGALLQRVNSLLIDCNSRQLSDWSNFLDCLTDTLSTVGPTTPTPLELLPAQVIAHHAHKHGTLSSDKIHLLEKCFVF